jgi:hypothetical protein
MRADEVNIAVGGLFVFHQPPVERMEMSTDNLYG